MSYVPKNVCSKKAYGKDVYSKDAKAKILYMPFGSQSWEKQNMKG